MRCFIGAQNSFLKLCIFLPIFSRNYLSEESFFPFDLIAESQFHQNEPNPTSGSDSYVYFFLCIFDFFKMYVFWLFLLAIFECWEICWNMKYIFQRLDLFSDSKQFVIAISQKCKKRVFFKHFAI